MGTIKKSALWKRIQEADFDNLNDPWLKLQPYVDPDMDLKERVKMMDLMFALRYDINTPKHRFEFYYMWYVSPSGNTMVLCDPTDCQFLKLRKDEITHSLANQGFKWLTRNCW